jgi:hypothetical protein
MIFFPGRVNRVSAIKEKVMVQVDYRVLKIVECGGFGGEAVFPKVVL